MKLGHIELNTDDMTYDEVNDLVQELRAIRTRKAELHGRVNTLQSMAFNMREEQMAWVNKHTGEVFNPDDWVLYDETTRTFYTEEEHK